jgi:diguanylate cyclase (GGDEF)-like protein
MKRPGADPYGLLRPVADRVLEGAVEVIDPLEQRRQRRVYEHIEVLRAVLPLALALNLAAGAILVAVLHGRVPHAPLFAWLLALTAIAVASGLLLWNRRLAARPQPWMRCFVCTLGALGLAWGALCLCLPAEAPVANAVSALWACAMTAGTAVAYSESFAAIASFAIASLVPHALTLLVRLEALSAGLGAGVLLFLAFALAAAKRHGDTVLANVQAQEDRDALVTALDADKRYIEELDEILRAGIIEREQVEAALSDARDTADHLADKLTSLTSLDGLTGIANRRYLDESVRREWSRAGRYATPLTIILCDIDRFRGYNDRYGHQAGDGCLRVIAEVLKSHCRRGGDLAARYGGEEFALLLPATELWHGARIAESMREAIRRRAITHEASDVARVLTASFGVATVVPQAQLDPMLLLHTAERALERAKSAGRNTVRTGLPFEELDPRASA